MSFGGGSSKGFQQQLFYTLLAQQNALRQLTLDQDQRRQSELAADKKRQEEADAAEKAAQAATQSKAKLSIFDAIKTSPQGLLNEPKTGKLTLLGN